MPLVRITKTEHGPLRVTDAATGDLLPATGIALEADAPGPNQHVGCAVTLSSPRTLADIVTHADLVYDRDASTDVDAGDLPADLLELLDRMDVPACTGDHDRFGCERERLILAYKLGTLNAPPSS